jgi:hypothetical protein
MYLPPSQHRMDKMMSRMIIAYSNKNKLFCQIHVRTKLLEKDKAQDFFLPLKKSSTTYLAQLSAEGEDVVRSLAEVDGLHRIGVNLYCLSLHLSPVFTWEEVIDEIIVIVKDECYLDKEVEVMYTTIEELYSTE